MSGAHPPTDYVEPEVKTNTGEIRITTNPLHESTAPTNSISNTVRHSIPTSSRESEPIPSEVSIPPVSTQDMTPCYPRPNSRPVPFLVGVDVIRDDDRGQNSY